MMAIRGRRDQLVPQATQASPAPRGTPAPSVPQETRGPRGQPATPALLDRPDRKELLELRVRAAPPGQPERLETPV